MKQLTAADCTKTFFARTSQSLHTHTLRGPTTAPPAARHLSTAPDETRRHPVGGVETRRAHTVARISTQRTHATVLTHSYRRRERAGRSAALKRSSWATARATRVHALGRLAAHTLQPNNPTRYIRRSPSPPTPHLPSFAACCSQRDSLWARRHQGPPAMVGALRTWQSRSPQRRHTLH